MLFSQLAKHTLTLRLLPCTLVGLSQVPPVLSDKRALPSITPQLQFRLAKHDKAAFPDTEFPRSLVDEHQTFRTDEILIKSSRSATYSATQLSEIVCNDMQDHEFYVSAILLSSQLSTPDSSVMFKKCFSNLKPSYDFSELSFLFNRELLARSGN